MKRNIIIFLVVLMIILSSCSGKDINIEITPELKNTATLEEKPTETAQPAPSAVPTASPTPEPSQPKYIFIVIGDGFGRGAMTMGEIYARLENEDMDKGASWESFAYQSYVNAMSESASGGTAIASGIETNPLDIGKDVEGNILYTIMDRAKENGFATGVVTNSNLIDATPATFLGHTTYRYNFQSIASQFLQSNVDYLAGGGMGYIISDDLGRSFGRLDSMGYNPTLSGPPDAISNMVEMGYETYFGMEGAVEMKELIEAEEFTAKKSIGIYTGGIMPYEYHKYNSYKNELYENVPSLIDMTEAGIQSLSQDEDGFIMMIESGLIDKTGHKFSQEMMTYQVNTLDNLLGHLLDFYYSHPYETLIILTADHETGNYLYDNELFEEWKAKPNFTWTEDADKMAEFLNSEWGLSSYAPNLLTQINYANQNNWETTDENRARLYSAVTLDVCTKYGVKIRADQHSGQLVPLYTIGKQSEEFEGSTHIKEIPIMICEIMGWEALPEIIIEN